MINRVVTLSQYRVETQSRKVRASASQVAHMRDMLEQAKSAQDEYKQWQLEETQRLFEQLALAPATTEQLKEYNTRLAIFKVQLSEYNKAVLEAENNYENAQKQLKQEIRELQKLQKVQEKYEYVSGQISLIVEQEQQRKEENISADEAEDARAGKKPCSCD